MSISRCCKPDFVLRVVRMCAHLSMPPGAAFPPERDATYPEPSDGPPGSLFCLAPDWVCPASFVTSGAVGSYPTISPLPRVPLSETRGGIFSATLSVTPSLPDAPPLSRGILPCGVRTFLSSFARQANARTSKSTRERCKTPAPGASDIFEVEKSGFQ